jgi:uncharacterized phage protein (TIGR01671 family)
MRPIKFRGVSTVKNEFVYGQLLEDTNKFYIITNNALQYEIDPETVGQFTGLTDKNGKEIYEGDIIRHNDYSNGAYLSGNQPQRISKVVVSDLFNGCKLHGLGFELSKKQLELTEVIGNIHQNPELL